MSWPICEYRIDWSLRLENKYLQELGPRSQYFKTRQSPSHRSSEEQEAVVKFYATRSSITTGYFDWMRNNSFCNRSRQWAETMFGLIHNNLSDETHSTTSDLVPCGLGTIDQLHRASDPLTPFSEARRILEQLESTSEDAIKSESAISRTVSLHSRRLYTECRLFLSLLELKNLDKDDITEHEWERAVSRLDMAIIIVGAPGDGRLDLILDTIAVIQAEHLPLAENSQHFAISANLDLPPVNIGSLASNEIPRIPPPSVATFQRTSSMPFILPGAVKDWPALTNHPWTSPAYLLHVSGRGRVVPVEIGCDYRTDDWSQKILPWEAFLQGIGVALDIHNNVNEDSKDNLRSGDVANEEVLYLAQHNLLTQFPALRSDIIVPDYVYSSPPPPDAFPSYCPPGNDEQLVINAWLGPKGTVSPAHTDPYFNCYAQVVGRKTVWLAPPHLQREMYPYINPNAPHTTRATPTINDNDRNQQTALLLSNTSRVDVFTPLNFDATSFPLFEQFARRNAFCTVLQPGDLLFIPPGWWHAMRCEDISFSVSMWF